MVVRKLKIAADETGLNKLGVFTYACLYIAV